MTKKIKNNSGSNKIYKGQLIAPGEYFTIPEHNEGDWSRDSTVQEDIGNGSLVFNDGISDESSAANALIRLKTKDIGYLQYSLASNATTSSTTFAALSLSTDRSSFPNAMFSKSSATDFKALVKMSARITYSIRATPVANDRSTLTRVTINDVEVPYSYTQTLGKNINERVNSSSKVFIVDLEPNDIVKLEVATAESGESSTVLATHTFMLVEYIRSRA